MNVFRFAAGCFLIVLGIFMGLIDQSFIVLLPAVFLLIAGIVLLWLSFQGHVVPTPGGKVLPTGDGVSGVVKNLKKEGDVHSFWLELSGQGGKAVFVEAYLKDVVLAEGDLVWVKGRVVEGQTLLTSEAKKLTSANVSFSAQPSKPAPDSPRLGSFEYIPIPRGGTGINVVKIFLWLFGSTIIAGVVSFVLAYSISYVMATDYERGSLDFADFSPIWVVIFVVVFVILQVVVIRSGILKTEKKILLDKLPAYSSQFQEPFFDQKRGYLEGPASSVRSESRSMGQGGSHHVLHFRVEFRDPDTNSVIRTVPVLIEGLEMNWVGEISEGDRAKVEGKYEADGILHAERAINLRTRSIVGNKQ